MKLGVDYSYGPLSPASLRMAGKSFVCRYLSTPGNAKNLGLNEARAFRAGGIDIVTVFETTADRALHGRTAGALDAKSAYSQLVALQAPTRAPIYFAVDFDAKPGQQAVINAYLAGAAEVLGHGRVGVYGGYYVVKRCLDAQVCKYAWQTTAWSGGQWDQRAHIRQSGGARIAGVSCDLDQAMTPDFGQWPVTVRPVPKPKPGPKPAPKPKSNKPYIVRTTDRHGVTGAFPSKLPGFLRVLASFKRGKFKKISLERA